MRNAFAQSAYNIESRLFSRIVERYGHRGGRDLAGLQRREISGRPSGDDEQFVITRILEALELERFAQRCDRAAGQ